MADGTRLEFVSNISEEPTVVITTPIVQPAPNHLRQGVNPLFAYLTVGLLALIVGGGIVWWMLSDSKGLSNNVGSADSISEPENSDTRSSSNQAGTTKSLTKSTQQNLSSPENEARAALDGWVQTLIDHDLEKHVSYYADRLELHREKQNVDIASVRDFNRKLFAKYSQFNLRISNINVISGTDGTVTTTFTSVYDYRGQRRHAGTDARTEMRWKKINGDWKIVSER